MKKYQVIVTMGGTGKRFVDAGYVLPKYMLPVNISNSHFKVIDLIAGMYKDPNASFIFLCNENHIDKYNLKGLLGQYGKVVPVTPGAGPGDAIYQASYFIDPNLPVFVQYCDTFQPWDINFVKCYLDKLMPEAMVVVTDKNCPSAYDGTLYGRVKIDHRGRVIDIKEKADPSFSEYIGCGTFFFRNGKILLKYIDIQDKNRDKYYLNGESYINCTIKAMLDDGMNVIPFFVLNYLNLGVPRDYEEFMYWQKTMKLLQDFDKKHMPVIPNSVLVMPAAGLGSRFKGFYEKPKPLISIFGNKIPMFKEAIDHSFSPEKVNVVSRKDLEFFNELKDAVLDNNYEFTVLDKITSGQAVTVLEGLDSVKDDQIVIVNSCDQGILFDESKFFEIYPEADIIVCGIKGYQPAIQKPNSFSWLRVDGNDVWNVTTKHCKDDPKNSYAFVSCLLYKNKSILKKSIDWLIDRKRNSNDELYIDESINDSLVLGYKVKMLEIDSYLNWGTPEELELFQLWKQFFTNERFYDYLA